MMGGESNLYGRDRAVAAPVFEKWVAWRSVVRSTAWLHLKDFVQNAPDKLPESAAVTVASVFSEWAAVWVGDFPDWLGKTLPVAGDLVSCNPWSYPKQATFAALAKNHLQ